MTGEQTAIRAQPGPQEAALASPADIVIFGGGRGGGKSWGLLLSVVQNARVPAFAAEIFRRTYPELTATGGLWPESYRIFPHIAGTPREGDLRWTFPSGARVKFSHMQYASDRFNWKGAQIPFVGFDQLELFDESQFWYLVSCNRDPSGTVRPWMFATCNPVPEDDVVGGWLHRFIQWWIDPETGRAIDKRSGAVRWMLRNEAGGLDWADEPSALLRRHPPGSDPKSVTFIRSLLDDNPAFVAADPGYRGRLMLLPLVEREQALGGNWNARPSAGKVFNRSWFSVVDAIPVGVT